MEISEAGLRKTALDGLVQGWVLHDREALEVFIEGLPAGNDTSKVEASYWRYFTEAEPKAAADKALTITDPTQQTEILNRVLVYY